MQCNFSKFNYWLYTFESCHFFCCIFQSFRAEMYKQKNFFSQKYATFELLVDALQKYRGSRLVYVMFSVGTIPSHKDIRCLGFFTKNFIEVMLSHNVFYTNFRKKREKKVCALCLSLHSSSRSSILLELRNKHY